MKDFAALMKSQERFRIVHVLSWNDDVRINRLCAAGVLEMVELQEGFQKDDRGYIVDPAAALEFATEFCARTIADVTGVLLLDSKEGREYLSLEFNALKTLVIELIDLHGLNDDEVEKKGT